MTTRSQDLMRDDSPATCADVNVDEAGTTATLVLLSVGLLVLITLAQPLNGARRLLIGAMATVMVFAVVVPGLRNFFALDPPPPIVVLASVGIEAISERLLGMDARRAVRGPPSDVGGHPVDDGPSVAATGAGVS